MVVCTGRAAWIGRSSRCRASRHRRRRPTHLRRQVRPTRRRRALLRPRPRHRHPSPDPRPRPHPRPRPRHPGRRSGPSISRRRVLTSATWGRIRALSNARAPSSSWRKSKGSPPARSASATGPSTTVRTVGPGRRYPPDVPCRPHPTTRPCCGGGITRPAPTAPADCPTSSFARASTIRRRLPASLLASLLPFPRTGPRLHARPCRRRRRRRPTAAASTCGFDCSTSSKPRRCGLRIGAAAPEQ